MTLPRQPSSACQASYTENRTVPSPNEQAALKCVYFAVMALDPTGKGRARWTRRWKGTLNAFDITFNGQLSAHSH